MKKMKKNKINSARLSPNSKAKTNTCSLIIVQMLPERSLFGSGPGIERELGRGWKHGRMDGRTDFVRDLHDFVPLPVLILLEKTEASCNYCNSD